MNRSLIVLQSFPRPRPTTNPYLIMLANSLRLIPGVEVVNFSWKAALTSRYDIFHVHWPEILVTGSTRVKKLARQFLFGALLVRLKATRTPLVRTVHNLELPSGISRREVWLLKLAERLTTLRITINTSTTIPADQPSAMILHGHYRDWFASHPKDDSQPGRIAYFGLIRRYKGVDDLIMAFRQTASTADGLTLSIAGRPSTDELATELTTLSAPDERISLTLYFLSDGDLVKQVGAAELIVLPYKEMHNSGGALTALSLDRPVLVPDNEVNRKFSEEVGPGWVHRYEGNLKGGDILNALTSVQILPRSRRPNLSGREWERAAADHVTAYLRAIDIRKSPGNLSRLR